MRHLFLFSLLCLCAVVGSAQAEVIVGAARWESYKDLLAGKRIALVVNQTSAIGEQHLVDFLLAHNVNIVRLFAPEHGFRGEADAGQKVKDGKDIKTNLPIISLYGNNKKPKKEQLADVDLVVFDIQDVGVRFYTYISTLTYVMEACAQQNKPLLVLDRPNPNAHYVDGPVLDSAFSSFIGLHPVPIVYGMTIGEYATMVNGQKWLHTSQKCQLTVITCQNYTHQTIYTLPIAPSPNLRDMKSIYAYPSICLFEGTESSEGRGTTFPFLIFGNPTYKGSANYTFTPQAGAGSQNPKLKDKLCRGYNLSDLSETEIRNWKNIDLSYLIDVYAHTPEKSTFFLKNNFFDKLAGTSELRLDIIRKKNIASIKASWQSKLNHFKQIRRKYLLYKE
jgi:uncharacterized protein YbbC (DUF1343 family)